MGESNPITFFQLSTKSIEFCLETYFGDLVFEYVTSYWQKMKKWKNENVNI